MIDHEESSTPGVPDTPHTISLAVWDLSSPLVMGGRSKIKVGAKCSAGCPLGNKEIEIHDETGARVAGGKLGVTPWPGTSALYWAEVDFMAPATDGTCRWAATLNPAELELPHGRTSSNFGFITVKPPEHIVTVMVIEKDTRVPFGGVEVRFGPYRASTDQNGMAKVELPKGTYELTVWKVGYETPSKTMEVSGDVTVQVEIFAVLEPEQEYWK